MGITRLPPAPGRLVNGGEVGEPAVSGMGLGLEIPEDLVDLIRIGLEGEEIRGSVKDPDAVAEPVGEVAGKGPVGRTDLDPAGRRGPHPVRPAVGKIRRGHRRSPDRNPLVSRPPRVPGLADAFLKDRPGRAVGAAFEVEDRTGRFFGFPDFLLKKGQSLDKGFRPGRATRYINVHRDDLIHPLDHAVNVIHPPGVGT